MPDPTPLTRLADWPDYVTGDVAAGPLVPSDPAPRDEATDLRRALQALYDACEAEANFAGGEFGAIVGPAAYEAARVLGQPFDEAGA